MDCIKIFLVNGCSLVHARAVEKQDTSLDHATYHEYTSSLGGKTVSPPRTSASINFFRAMNSGLTISSLSRANQLGSRVLISSDRCFFCSAVNVATQAALLNLDAGFPAVEDVEPGAEGVVFGGPKNEVMLPFVLAFLFTSTAPAPTFRFREDIIRVCRCVFVRVFLGECGFVQLSV